MICSNFIFNNVLELNSQGLQEILQTLFNNLNLEVIIKFSKQLECKKTANKYQKAITVLKHQYNFSPKMCFMMHCLYCSFYQR